MKAKNCLNCHLCSDRGGACKRTQERGGEGGVKSVFRIETSFNNFANGAICILYLHNILAINLRKCFTFDEKL